jgi:membrane protein
MYRTDGYCNSAAKVSKFTQIDMRDNVHGNKRLRMIAIAKPLKGSGTLLRNLWMGIVLIGNELGRTRAFTAAAALAFYFLLSLVPLLIVIASLLSYLPFSNILGQILGMMAALIPPESINLVQSVVSSILEPGHGKLISFGILSYLWAATGGFSSLSEALDIAYDVTDCRPWWRERLQAFLLTFTVGVMAMFSLLLVILGPHFGHILVQFFSLPPSFGHIWPFLRWVITLTTFVICLEWMYYLGPHARHSFWSTLPGAAVAVATWFLGSFGLSFYLDHLANYNKTYGSLGAVIGLMLWLYITSLAVLIGAELNAELGKRRRARRMFAL